MCLPLYHLPSGFCRDKFLILCLDSRGVYLLGPQAILFQPPSDCSLRNFLRLNSASRLALAFVILLLDYGNSLFAGLSEKDISLLQQLQNAAAHIVSKSNRFDSISPTLAKLHWLSVKQRIDFKIATLVYKCINDYTPGYLSELLSLAFSIRLANQRILTICHQRPPVPLTMYIPHGKVFIEHSTLLLLFINVHRSMLSTTPVVNNCR